MPIEGAEERDRERPIPDTEVISRRGALGEFVKWVGIGSAWTVPVVGLNVASELFRFSELDTSQAEARSKAKQELESGKFGVSTFAEDIVRSSIDLATDTSIPDAVSVISSWFAGTAIGGYLLRNHSKIMNSLIGAGGALTGKAVDVISTLSAVEYLSDPRCHEYGIDTYFAEGNLFSSANPTPDEVIRLGMITGIMNALGSLRFPTPGRGYLAASPFIFRHNVQIAYTIGISLQIGDKVKEMIQEGRSAKYIQDYIQAFRLTNENSKAASSSGV